MSSNINPVPSTSAQQPLATVQQHTLEESYSVDRAKIIRSAVTALFIALALGAAVAGTALSAIYATPIFLTFIIASVLFTIAAHASYKLLTPPAIEFDWINSANNNFRPLADTAVYAHFVSKYNFGTWFQNKLKPNVTVCIPRHTQSASYSALFPTIFREDRGLGLINFNGTIVNPIHPIVQHIQADTNNLSETIHRHLSAYPFGQQEWLQGQFKPQSNSQHPLPFSPGEARLTPLTTKDFATQHRKGYHPSFLMHVRGCLLSEFQGSAQQIANQYYQEMRNIYTTILEKATEADSIIILLPLFSEIYETEAYQGISLTAADNLCLTALFDATNNFAKTSSFSKRLLITLQPRQRVS